MTGKMEERIILALAMLADHIEDMQAGDITYYRVIEELNDVLEGIRKPRKYYKKQ